MTEEKKRECCEHDYESACACCINECENCRDKSGEDIVWRTSLTRDQVNHLSMGQFYRLTKALDDNFTEIISEYDVTD